MVHNHPIACSLSHQDLITASGQEFGIWAVAGDGGRFYADGYKANPWVVMMEQDYARAACYDLLRPFVDGKVVDEDQAALVLSHLVNLVLSAKGLVKDYGFVLGHTTLEAIGTVAGEFERFQPKLAAKWREQESRG